jgi:formylglycine-generating enzyme required for sulfatase activity
MQAGVYLGRLGDPRPGVCTLPPAMVRIEGGEFVIGSTPEEVEEAGKAYEQYYLERGDPDTAQRARTWPQDELDEIDYLTFTIPTFEIGRYPVTNAQFELFIKDGGYYSDRSWWSDLRIRSARIPYNMPADEFDSVKLHNWLDNVKHPNWWFDERFGIARPNHPVVGVSLEEAVAFCRWLSQHQVYNPEGYTYLLPSEPEWEYAARRTTRRIYPWGNEKPDTERANFNHMYGGTTSVGCFVPGATPEERLCDLAGNVDEWTRSEHNGYTYDPGDTWDSRDFLLSLSHDAFAVRGGGWRHPPVNLRAASRQSYGTDRNHYIGFRLVRYPPNKT